MKVRTETRRQAILEAAAQLFREVGYERASMNELTSRLGGSKSTLYGYFPSKEALFVAVVQSFATAHLSEAADKLSAESTGPIKLETLLTRFGERTLQVLTNDADALAVYRMVLAEAGRSDIGQLFYDSGPAEYVEKLAQLLARAVERGELRRLDPKVAASQFLALLTAETNTRVYQVAPPPLTVAQIRGMVRRAVEMFLLGAATAPSRR